MKSIICLLLLWPFFASANPSGKFSIRTKLQAVNSEWKHYDLPKDFVPANVHPTEKELIQMHLSLVEKNLRARDVSHLSRNQILNRTNTLDILHNYWNAGVFPKNTFHVQRTPYFIDIYGTYCAVGYLIKETGFDAVAKKINQENNYGYLRDLAAQYNEINVWAKEFGFTIDELAWIQPMYIAPTCIPYNNFSNDHDTIIKEPCISDGFIKVPDPSTWCAQLPVSATICSYETFYQQDSLPSGNYTITVTDANNLSKTYQINLKDSLKILMHQQFISCVPSKLYSITVDSVINGLGPFTYSLQGGFNNNNGQPGNMFDSLLWWSAVNMQPGHVVATDFSGCFSREPFFPNQDFGYPIVFSKNHPATCQNPCSGSISIDSIWNANGPVSYYKMVNGNWILNNSNVFDSLCVGTLHFKIQDSLGCTDQQYLNVAMGSPPNYFQLNISQANVPLCNGQPVNLNVGINGGVQPYTQLVQNMGQSLMKVKVTDSLGCVLDTMVNITEPGLLTIKDSVVQTVCGNTPGIINIAAVGGTPPYTGVGNTILNIGVNNYIITDANGCTLNKYKYMPNYPVNITSSIVSPQN